MIGDQDAAASVIQLRWSATVHYRHNAGMIDVTHDIKELHELQDLVERGPHWDTIDRIVIVRAVSHELTLTVEEAKKL